MKAICEAAELTERYFYESFANSEALLIAAYGHVVGHLHEEMTAARRSRRRRCRDEAARGADALFHAAEAAPEARAGLSAGNFRHQSGGRCRQARRPARLQRHPGAAGARSEAQRQGRGRIAALGRHGRRRHLDRAALGVEAIPAGRRGGRRDRRQLLPRGADRSRPP
ncbi:hypothetical protein [Bradyrhizobium elkanii]